MFKFLNNIDDICNEKWDDLLANSIYSSWFQSHEFYSFISGCNSFSPFVFAAEEDSKYNFLLIGTIQRNGGYFGSIFSSRAIASGGVVIRDNLNDKSELNLFLKYISKDLKRKAIYLEIRNLFDYSSNRQDFLMAGYQYSEHLNIQVNITDKKELIRKISKSKFRQVKKSLKSGASIKVADSIYEIEQFYRILKAAYRKRIRLPLPGWDFFERFYSTGSGVFLLIIFKNRIIGGIMCPVWKNRTIYEWYISGEDRLHNEVYPSVLATWAAMEYGSDNNIRQFDFMGAGSPDANYGVRKFKEGFGGELVENGRFRYVFNKPLYVLGRFIIKMMSR